MMRWLDTLLCGICVLTVAWIVVTFGDGTGIATHGKFTFMGQPETETETEPVTESPIVDLTELPVFAELQARPLRNMLAPVTAASDRELAARRHRQLLVSARRRNAIAAMQRPVTTSRRNVINNDSQRRRERDQARRLHSQRAQSKYQRRQTTVFERTRHYANNRYGYEYTNTNGRRNARLSSNRSRNLRVPIAHRRRR